LHPLGAAWVNAHGDYAEGNSSSCQACHGTDYRGGVLSAAQSTWTASTRYGSKNFWRGYRIGCYTCHNGPNSESASSNHAPVVVNTSIDTDYDTAANVTLSASDSDANALTLRIVTQPAHGAVALANRVATYTPEAGFVGDEEFTFAASDTKADSNLGRVVVHVRAPTYQIGADTSGAFYDPAQSGHGWFVEALADHAVLVGWYVYLDGEQRWLTGSGIASGDRVRVRLTIGANGQFPPNYALASTQLATWGELELRFADNAHATATWITPYPGFNAGQMALTRLTSLAPSDLSSPVGQLTACHSGTWYNPSQSGHGLQIQILGQGASREMLAIWYTYLNGQQRWLLAQGPVQTGATTLAAITTTGGDFPPAFNPTQVTTQAWGSLQFRAIDGDHLRLEWNSTLPGFGSGGLDLTRLTQVSGHACP
jgi:hypothetical protein